MFVQDKKSATTTLFAVGNFRLILDRFSRARGQEIIFVSFWILVEINKQKQQQMKMTLKILKS